MKKIAIQETIHTKTGNTYRSIFVDEHYKCETLNEWVDFQHQGLDSYIAEVNAWAEKVLVELNHWPPVSPDFRHAAAFNLSKKLAVNSLEYFAARAIGFSCELLSAIERGDAQQAARSGIKLEEARLSALIQAMERKYLTGAKSTDASKTSNAKRTEEAEKKRKKYQEKANGIWARKPGLSKTAVAKLIDKTYWNTVRNRINRPN